MSGISRVTVIVRNGDITKALKVFKKKVTDSGHLLELKERQEYTKPTARRRMEKQNAIRNNSRRIIEEKMLTGEYKSGKKHKK